MEEGGPGIVGPPTLTGPRPDRPSVRVFSREWQTFCSAWLALVEVSVLQHYSAVVEHNGFRVRPGLPHEVFYLPGYSAFGKIVLGHEEDQQPVWGEHHPCLSTT